MQIQTESNTKITRKQKHLISQKLQKLERFYDRIGQASVFIRKEKEEHPDTYLVEVKLDVPGQNLFAKQSSDSLEKSLAEVTEKLRRQIKRHKELNDNKRPV